MANLNKEMKELSEKYRYVNKFVEAVKEKLKEEATGRKENEDIKMIKEEIEVINKRMEELSEKYCYVNKILLCTSLQKQTQLNL